MVSYKIKKVKSVKPASKLPLGKFEEGELAKMSLDQKGCLVIAKTYGKD